MGFTNSDGGSAAIGKEAVAQHGCYKCSWQKKLKSGYQKFWNDMILLSSLVFKLMHQIQERI